MGAGEGTCIKLQVPEKSLCLHYNLELFIVLSTLKALIQRPSEENLHPLVSPHMCNNDVLFKGGLFLRLVLLWVIV